MKTAVDKSLVLGGCVYLLLVSGAPVGAVVWLLVAVVLSSLCGLWDSSPGAGRRVLAVPAAYLAAGCLSAGSLPGTPLAAYDLARAAVLYAGSRPQAAPGGTEPAGAGEPEGAARCPGGPGDSYLSRSSGWLLLGCGAPLLAAAPGQDPGPGTVVRTLVVCVLASTLAVRTAQEERVRDRLHALRDDLYVKVVALQRANARILEAQDYEVQAAALSERTRIARDIHDTVGHLLTRLTLRVKALQVLHRDEPTLVEELDGLGSTLDEALSSVRSSVHALSDDGEDLAVSLNRLGSGCGIETVHVDCAPRALPPAHVSRCLTAVVREALTNAARHGQASSAWVTVADLPGFWRVTVANDGPPPRRGEPVPAGAEPAGPGLEVVRGGLGLRSMTERVESLGGTLRVLTRPRFTVIATVPREGEEKEDA